jgi:tRNA(Ile)-lysidine synthase
MVVHVDHQISANSQQWAAHVVKWCREWSVECELKVVSLEGLGSNLEFAARKARYAALTSTGADAILLAHHADDQIETVLMKLMRGSGVKGLKGMSELAACWYDDRVNILRPLLGRTRYELEQYATEHGVENIEDESNQDLRYDRNWIRSVLWPTIKARYEIADININRSVGFLGEAWALTQELAAMDLAQCQERPGVLLWTKLNPLSAVRIKNLLLHILDLESVQNFSTNHIEQFANGLKSATMDSNNELRLSTFSMSKRGKRITWHHHVSSSQFSGQKAA